LERCLELARRGGSRVLPNPLVGVVLVGENGEIIGEGWYKEYGGSHAEVVAIENVKNKKLLKNATLYVSLEPCNHYGKTPPCTDLIIKSGIKKVVVGCLDPNPLVAGAGIKKLKDNGIEIVLNHNTTQFQLLNKFFFVNQLENRPYILLKWAESKNGVIGSGEVGNPLLISGDWAKCYVHKLRSEYQAIFVGYNTVIQDNPKLNTRFFYGDSPIRITMGRGCELPQDSLFFRDEGRAIILNDVKNERVRNIEWFCPNSSLENIKGWSSDLYQKFDIGSILVEGGANVLQKFLDEYIFDELMVIRSSNVLAGKVLAQKVPDSIQLESIEELGKDVVYFYKNKPK